MQRDQSLFIVSQRRRIWQKRQTNPTNSNVRRAHRRNRATLSAIIRELERLLIELKRKPMSDPWPLLDHLDALIAPTKQLSKRIKRGQNKALTTAFCERLPQVMV
jgi:DNA polymerase III delta subunit